MAATPSIFLVCVILPDKKRVIKRCDHTTTVNDLLGPDGTDAEGAEGGRALKSDIWEGKHFYLKFIFFSFKFDLN